MLFIVKSRSAPIAREFVLEIVDLATASTKTSGAFGHGTVLDGTFAGLVYYYL